jgi:general secretion pathway protein G
MESALMKKRPRSEVRTDTERSERILSIGFTLLELLVAIVIVGILGGIAHPLYTEYKEKARIAVACVDMQNISAAANTYFTENSKYPESLNEVGLSTLLDPWGSPYQYLNIQTAKGKGSFRKDHFLVPLNTDYDLYSMGKDRQSVPPLTAKASKDDIIRARNGAYIGLASGF